MSIKFTTTFDQIVAYHDSGCPITTIRDITTSLTDYAPELDPDTMSGPSRDWWNDVLQTIHLANLRLQCLDPDHRIRAAHYLADHGADSVEGFQTAILRAVEYTR